MSVLLLCMLMYLFRDVLAGCVSRWTTEPQYSHGFVIPIMAIGLAYARRNRILPGRARSSLIGFGILLTAVLIHGVAVYLFVEAMDAVAFVVSIAGIILLVWGSRLFRGIWPAVGFLMFMMPLPFQMERMLSGPLQVAGAQEAAWYIQTLGIPAVAEGNTIVMGMTRVGVAEACSGLRMLMVFFAISVAAMILSERSRWEKLLILFSAVPIALICNIARIIATAVAHQRFGRESADFVFHDVSGWLMMPLAMLLLYLELRIFDWLFVEVDDRIPGVAPQVQPGRQTMVSSGKPSIVSSGSRA